MAAQSQDNFATWGVILVCLCVMIFGIWLAFYHIVGPLLIDFKRGQLWLISFVSDDAKRYYQTITSMLEIIRRDPKGYGASEMWSKFVLCSIMVGSFLRWPVAIIFLAAAVYVAFKYPSSMFKMTYDMDSFISRQSATWQVIKPFVKYNPISSKARPPGAKVPEELPMFAEAFYPEEWVAFNRIRFVSGVPDRDQIRRALMDQLGGVFTELDRLPDHVYCLLAAFALKGARKRDEADDLIGAIASSWSAETGLVVSSQVKAKASAVLSNRKYAEPLLNVMGKHAYVATAVMAALAWARREGGVLAPAQFAWLRGEHRELWYPLNNLGRRAFHVEAAGAMAHYQAELGAGRPLIMPRLDAAVVAIVQYLSESRPRIPELESKVQLPPPAAAKA